MAKHIFSNKTFREAFTFVNKNSTTWFPGHMHKGMMQLQAKLKDIDCIIEVHDARIPFAGRNPNFQTHLMVRPHILVLNKMDLADLSRRKEVEQRLKDEGVKTVLYTDCRDNKDKVIKSQLIPTALNLIKNSERYHRTEETTYNMLVIGIPNVGKSSLINKLRNLNRKINPGKASQVGAVPGITRSVMEKIIVCDQPKIYVRDSPGILDPSVKDVHVGMKLAVCATLKDHLVGEEIVADYMLYWLNKLDNFQYVDYFGLKNPTDDILQFLMEVAKKYNFSRKHRSVEGGGVQMRPDLGRAAHFALKAFREGKLGKVMMDVDYIYTNR
ncbi:mitochondrial ribosome-associated GTPase 1-like [Lineus longissimus]|uniref:mitochondrial ribosome-associated GTPase 1-like n=1 Tax=Lineus longissimus TaxID=88925 RepID=UPI002B4D9A70